MRLYTIFVLIFFSLSISAQTDLEDAERSLVMKNYTNTIKICKTMLEIEPGRDDIRIILGMAYQGMQDYQSALEAYNKCASQDDITMLYLKAECFETLADIPSAISIYSSILESDSTNMHATRNIARIDLKTKNYPAAKIYYTKLVGEYPDNYLFQKNLGICNYQLREEFAAMDNFREAWTLNKKDLDLPINIANIYARIQQPHSALSILAEGLEYDSANIAIIKTAAFIHYRLEKYDTAAYQFEKILSLGDSSQFTRKYLGISYFNKSFYDGAVEHLKEAYLLDTLDTETTYYLGLALTTMHGKLEGIDFLKKTIELMIPDSVFIGSVYGSIGRALTDLNMRENSIFFYDKAFGYDPSHPIYIYEKAKMHDQLGTMHKNREQLNIAIREYEKFLEIQLAILEEVRIRRGLDEDQISAPGMNFSRERIKKIKNELFFMGEIEK